MKTLSVFLFTLLSITVKATTWNEPWHDKVVKQADSFVLAKVASYDEQKGVTITILTQLGGKPLTGTITINNFYLLNLCSQSAGEGPEFHFKNIDSCYFFIRQNENREYCIATPTSGFAVLKNGKVAATYRHSYHQALVDNDIYLKTMSAIFNNYHGLAYDKTYVNDFVSKYLSLKPAGFTNEELPTFFNQHVALECIYHLGLTGFYSKLIPFLNDENNFHHQVSAARALTAYNSPETDALLLTIIGNKPPSDFVKVMCIWALASHKPKGIKDTLKQLEKNASTEENGFGGNIMDPRVCTSIPDVKKALGELIAAIN